MPVAGGSHAETTGIVMGSNEPDRIKRLEKQTRRLKRELTLLSSSKSWRGSKRHQGIAGLKSVFMHDELEDAWETANDKLARAISWERRCSVSV